jgi:iron complex transport system permease protein
VSSAAGSPEAAAGAAAAAAGAAAPVLPTAGGAPVLEVRGLTLALGGRRILKDVSLCVEAGEILAVVGPNGSGKTTLLRALAGLLPEQASGVLLNGRRIASLAPRERARRIAYLPQLRETPAGFRASALVEMGRHPYVGEGEEARRQAALRALGRVGAEPLAGRRLETLSGGELQKVFLASVVAQETPLLLLDEPTVFLDPGRAVEIQHALLGLAAEGRTLVVVTHDLEFVTRFATRVVALRGGRIAFQGFPRVVFSAGALAALFGVPFTSAARPILPPPRPAFRKERPPDLEARPTLPPPEWAEAREAAALASIGTVARQEAMGQEEMGRGDAVPEEPQVAGQGAVLRAQLLLGALCAAVLLAAPFAGPTLSPTLPATGVIGPGRAESFILWQLRVPRVLLAGVAGGGLALAGAAFQALFRNPLATPYTLGVASGAAFGAVAALVAGVGLSVAGLTATSLGALAGALGITAAVYGLGRRRSALPTATLLLAGVTLSFFFSALILLLQYFADFTEAFRTLRWLMGEVRIVGYGPFAVLGPLAAAGGFLVLAHRSELNQLLTGEELAQARGVEVERVKRRLFLGSSLLVGGVVALCGPIGFVGLIVPHALRALLGPDHRRLAPACVPAGAAFLVVCDTVARLALAPAELPVGVMTALVGGPVFLAILLRRGPFGAG